MKATPTAISAAASSDGSSGIRAVRALATKELRSR